MAGVKVDIKTNNPKVTKFKVTGKILERSQKESRLARRAGSLRPP